MTEYAEPLPPRCKRQRWTVLAVCAVLCLPGLFFSWLALMAALSVGLTESLVDISARKIVWGGAGVLLGWSSLGALATAWARGRRLNRGWAIAGLVSGIGCTVLYIPFSVTTLPALILGGYLAVVALRRTGTTANANA